jgi:18S rRNA (adenine1779-N6/adenine1780-N6)-dimethyltransferase
MSAPRRATKKPGLFQMNHSLGQNMLKSKTVVKGIVDHAETRPGDIVLEIGPGVGNMTEEILTRGCNVLAIEKDPRMVVELTKKFPPSRTPALRLVHGDFLQVEMPQFDLCISNIPYNISSAIVFKLLERPTFRRAVLMVQKEFADRMVARPGHDGWGRLAINTQLYANVRIVMSVNRKNFVPPPQVDSAVVTLQPRENQPDVNFAEWDGLIKLCFSRPNRTLQATFKKKKTLALLDENRNNFLAMHGVEPGQPIADFVQGVLDSLVLCDSRPVQLDLEDFMNLLQAFNAGGLHFQ